MTIFSSILLAALVGFGGPDKDPMLIGYRGTTLKLGDPLEKVLKIFPDMWRDPNGVHWNDRSVRDYVTFIIGVNHQHINASIFCSFDAQGRLFSFCVSYLFDYEDHRLKFLRARKLIGPAELDDLWHATGAFDVTAGGVHRSLSFTPDATYPLLAFDVELVR